MGTKQYLGQTVTVQMDRPLGSKHPKHNFVYEVNYGFILNTISGDGEELDAYVLGIDVPMEEFTGECVAVIHRTDDDDDKLIVVPAGTITFFIKPNPDKIVNFTAVEFINQNNNSMQFIVNNDSIIIKRDIVFTKGNQLIKYNPGHRGLMTLTENNHLIIRAFAMAHKYKEIYERTGSVDDLLRTEKIGPTTAYGYLNLAYLNPEIVNDVMSGKTKYTVDELFKIASDNIM
ncbi:MAG: inorganic diphosphatase [Rickettsiales bacterium]|jgi:inorganic pyrophosphatase|nr:inorganic diphosphatase [Rickettsiales bacterium]